LLSFVTDLWTFRNMALMTLTPQSKNSSRSPATLHNLDNDWVDPGCPTSILAKEQ